MEFQWVDWEGKRTVFKNVEYPRDFVFACKIFSELYHSDRQAFFNVSVRRV